MNARVMTERTGSCSTLLVVTTAGVIVCLVVIPKLVQKFADADAAIERDA
jgi:hypothetical protein